MKKTIMLLSFLLIAVSSLLAQTDSTAIITNTSIFDTIWNLFPAFIASHAKAFGIIIFVAWAIEQIIPHIAWAPGNHILAVIWNWLKLIIKFLSTKK